MAEPDQDRVPTPGSIAPDFQVLDSAGLVQKLSSLAARRHLVLIFYRGYW
jgi:peroxiredoxin